MAGLGNFKDGRVVCDFVCPRCFGVDDQLAICILGPPFSSMADGVKSFVKDACETEEYWNDKKANILVIAF